MLRAFAARAVIQANSLWLLCELMSLVRQGDDGLAVGRVQQALLEAGYDVPNDERIAVHFGSGTYDAVRAFQVSHLGPSGVPLTEDGIVGDQTWWALQHPGGHTNYTVPGWRYDLSIVRAEVRPALETAVGEIGTCEQPDGSNDGPRIRLYTAPDFIGSPWCALFASWCFAKLDGGSPFGRIAATWAIYDWAVAKGRIVGAADTPQPGDIFLILRGSRNDPGRRGHTMIVCTDLGGGLFATIEGNASNAVRGCVRQKLSVSAVVRPVPLP